MAHAFNAEEMFEMAIRIEENGARFYRKWTFLIKFIYGKILKIIQHHLHHSAMVIKQSLLIRNFKIIHLSISMTIAGIQGVGGKIEFLMPAFGNPKLFALYNIADGTIQTASGMPDKPADGISTRRRPFMQVFSSKSIKNLFYFP